MLPAQHDLSQSIRVMPGIHRTATIRVTTNCLSKQIASLVAFAMLAACSGISVKSDRDPDANFSQFKSFAVLEKRQQSKLSPVDQHIRSAIVAQLTAKGLRQLNTTDEADLAIEYQVTTEERTVSQTLQSGWGYSGYQRSRALSENIDLTVGTLVIVAFQREGGKLVWNGSASGTINPYRSPRQRERRINDAVRRMFKDFPRSATARP